MAHSNSVLNNVGTTIRSKKRVILRLLDLSIREYYFPDKNSPHILTAFIPTLFFGIFLLSVVLLSSVLARSSYEALFITIGVQILLYFLQLFPKVQDYNPVELLGKNLDILAGKTDLASLKWNFLVSFILTLSALFLAVYQFNRKKL